MSAALQAAAAAWRMSFSSAHYLLFLPLAVGAYFLLPQKLRKVWLLLASYYFYFFAAPKYLVVLLLGTVVSWLLGLLVAAKGGAGTRRARLILSIAIMALSLAFFKYNSFFAAALSPLFAALGIEYSGGFFTTAAALGISFYTFTAIGYIIDASRGDVPVEKNLLNYALFLGFFPSVLMGPISRAAGLLPQLKDTSRRFSPAEAADALRGMAIGFFKKLAVADTLAVFTGAVYSSPEAYSGPTLTLAALAFALQLYFDFSGYSDIALGSARLLGIKLPANFANPYFATNFSSLWQRWHISLSTWLQDYIFMPLVWSRWPEKLPFLRGRNINPPVLSSITIVFLISGLWHGDTMCFLVWGALQALFRVGEEVCHRALGKPKKNMSFAARVGKTALVLALWVESLVFFRVGQLGGSIQDALGALAGQFDFSAAHPFADIYNAVLTGVFPSPALAIAFIAFTVFCLALALWADWLQCFRLDGAPLSAAVASLRPSVKWVVYYLIVLCCFAAFVAQSSASFLYGGY